VGGKSDWTVCTEVQCVSMLPGILLYFVLEIITE
jgi:hypothetical protein